MGFRSKLRIEHMIGTEKYTLIDLLIYVADDGFKLTVPAGFITDGASIPKLFRSIVGSPFAGKYVEAAAGHDYLCHTGIVSRREADSRFSQMMADLEVFVPRRKIMWLGVRLGAFGKWVSNLWKKKEEVVEDEEESG